MDWQTQQIQNKNTEYVKIDRNLDFEYEEEEPRNHICPYCQDIEIDASQKICVECQQSLRELES